MTQPKEKEVARSRVILSQVVACLALDLLLVGLGMSISFVTMVLPEVLDASQGLSITTHQASWFGSMAFLCQPLGSIFSGPLLDYFGRRRSLFIVNIPHVAAWLLMAYAWNVPALFIANALLGIGTGIMEAPSVTYVGEVSDPCVRGTLGAVTNGFTSAGMFLAYALGAALPWRQAALVALAVPLITMALVYFVPETPVWLLSKGRENEALSSLCRLRGWTTPASVKEEFDQLIEYNKILQQCIVCCKEGKKEAQNTCPHKQETFFKRILFKLKHEIFIKETMRPFGLVMAYFLFYNLSGFIPIRPNMVNFCKAMGMKYNSKNIVVLVGALLIVINVISGVTVKLIGKRKLILGSLFATACCSLSISVYANSELPASVFSYEPSTFPEGRSTFPVVLFLLVVCFNSLGIPWVLLSEVFPFRCRGTATGLAAAFSYIQIFLVSNTNYNLEEKLHLSGTFATYAVCGFIGTVYLYFYLPETERKTLAEIEEYYKGDKKVFADDFFINAFRKKRSTSLDADKPMLVN